MSQGIILRPFIGLDVPYIRTLDIQGYEHPIDDDEVRRLSPGILVAILEGKWVGYYAVEVEGSAVRLKRFTVTPQWRRNGVGIQMMHRLFHDYKGFRRITTVIPASNLGAAAFLRYIGFRCVNIIPNSATICGSKEDSYYFVYNLQKEKP